MKRFIAKLKNLSKLQAFLLTTILLSGIGLGAWVGLTQFTGSSTVTVTSADPSIISCTDDLTDRTPTCNAGGCQETFIIECTNNDVNTLNFLFGATTTPTDTEGDGCTVENDCSISCNPANGEVINNISPGTNIAMTCQHTCVAYACPSENLVEISVTPVG